MKLHFPWNEVERLLEEVTSAKTARPLYGEDTGKGFWLVGDHGIYLMPNTSDGLHHKNLGANDHCLVVYAKECNPSCMEFDDWWENKRRTFGGDDGVESLDLQKITQMLPRNGNKPDSLVISLTPKHMSLELGYKRANNQESASSITGAQTHH